MSNCIKSTSRLIFLLIAPVTSELYFSDELTEDQSNSIDRPFCRRHDTNKNITDSSVIRLQLAGKIQTRLTYYTSQLRGDAPACLADCGYVGTAYQWCYTKKDRSWDYCNSEGKGELVKTFLTFTGAPCKSVCRPVDDHFRCTTFWGDSRRCSPSIVSFHKVKTINGVDCMTSCSKEGTKYYWCWDFYGYWDYCAPYAKSRKPVRSIKTKKISLLLFLRN